MNRDLRLTLPDDLLEQLAQRVADILDERRVVAAAPAARWLTVDQAAEYLGAKRQRVYDLRSSGRLSRNGDGARALVDRRELDALISSGTGLR